MVKQNSLIFFQKDFNSLQKYLGNQKVTIDDIRRGLLVKLHNGNTEIPDHFYKLHNKITFEDISSLTELFTKAIPEFASEFLTIDYKNTITVNEEKFIDWQNTIADFSPLFLQAAYLYKNLSFPCTTIEDIEKLYADFICSNVSYTALASPAIKPIQDLFSKEGGFYDLHIHLNGVTESDAVWQNLLNEIDKNVRNISQNIKKEGFLQQTEQIGIPVTENLLTAMLQEAKNIRWDFFDAILKTRQTNMIQNSHDAYYNPFDLFFNALPDTKLPNKQLSHEMLMYVLVLQYLEKTNDEEIASKLHKYLLIFGFFEELIVHDAKEFGFEQFQKMTNNDIRSTCDNYQLNKFLQLAGNHLKNMQFVCFRFSPKESVDSQMKLLKKIDDDWKRFKNDYISLRNGEEFANKIDYRLIAHFIKQSDRKPKEYIRFADLRKNLDKKAHALQAVLAGKSELSKRIVGIDAAANELDAPPEVFAPVFTDLKKKGLIHHVTYHAGEDFYHILSGLRAIYEAIFFLDMSHGDRIGHATAAGTDVKTWIDILGNDLYIPQGIYMDDLIFVYHFIIEEKLDSLYQRIPFIARKIEELSLKIYGNFYPVSLQVEAWKNRGLNPEFICNPDKKTLAIKAYNSNFTVVSEQIFQILSAYNSKEHRKEYDLPIRIETEEVFSADELVLLQQSLLKYMHRKEIVIEALPTSNLRIGYHRSLQSYQLFNWFEWKRQEHSIPPIVLGSDDPGIFETNIYNEYALVYCYLVYEKKMSRDDVMKFIMDIYTNSRIYAFKE